MDVSKDLSNHRARYDYTLSIRVKIDIVSSKDLINDGAGHDITLTNSLEGLSNKNNRK